MLRALESAAARLDRGEAERDLGFVFVGAGYAGVEALAELHDLARDAVRRSYPTLRDVRQRWVLVDAAPTILSEIPRKLGEYTHRELEGRGIEIRVSTTLASFDGAGAVLSDGARIPARTLVWAAGVRPSPDLARLGLPLDDRGRVVVDAYLRVVGPARRMVARRLRGRAERAPPRAVRPADMPARPATGTAPRAQHDRPGGAVRLPHARPGRDARSLQGHRRAPGLPPPRVPRLVRRPDVPPVRAADDPPQGPRRRRLDGLARLPARHRRALRARPPPRARRRRERSG